MSTTQARDGAANAVAPAEESGIAEYLERHPDFFERNHAVLARLRLPHARGGTTISLVERQVEVLRERQATAEEKLAEFVAVARSNDILAERIQRLTRRLLRPGLVSVDMGVPDFDPASLPFTAPAEAARYHLQAEGEAIEFGAVSMGNPHAVIEVDDLGIGDIDAAPVATLGPALQRHAAFPDSVNVGFAQVVARDRVRLRVYERGVGETLACGSGACAAAAVLMRRGRVDREVSIELPGGTLRIAWPDDDATIAMAGPAMFVFEGEWRT